jgi:hypothetical protein
MRKGALLQNSQSREGGVSARCYRSGAFGFASRPGDSDAAIVAALAEARASGTLYERATGGNPASLPRTEPGTGIYDYRSRRDPLSAGERTDPLAPPERCGRAEISRSVECRSGAVEPRDRKDAGYLGRRRDLFLRAADQPLARPVIAGQ